MQCKNYWACERKMQNHSLSTSAESFMWWMTSYTEYSHSQRGYRWSWNSCSYCWTWSGGLWCIHIINPLTWQTRLSHNDYSIPKWGSEMASASSQAAALASNWWANPNANITCSFCKKKEHISEKCWIAHPELCPAHLGQRNNGGTKSANKVEEDNTKGKPVHELATSTSLQVSSSTPTRADLSWNTDTVPTSHMTPHQHWLWNHEAYSIPIHLANNDTVHSIGRGDIIFRPKSDGKPSQEIIFLKVLHVPALNNNLFSIFQPVLHNNYNVNPIITCSSC